MFTALCDAGVIEEVCKGLSWSLWPSRQEDNCHCALLRWDPPSSLPYCHTSPFSTVPFARSTWVTTIRPQRCWCPEQTWLHLGQYTLCFMDIHLQCCNQPGQQMPCIIIPVLTFALAVAFGEAEAQLACFYLKLYVWLGSGCQLVVYG